jgi:hypothetical protein
MLGRYRITSFGYESCVLVSGQLEVLSFDGAEIVCSKSDFTDS